MSESLDVSSLVVPLVNANHAHIDSSKNASSSRRFSVVHDFGLVEAAYGYKLSAEAHVEEHPKGDLTVQVGGVIKEYSAAVSQLEANLSLAANSVRLVLHWSLVTGKKVD